jgi:high-affinity K+ transport system ATPase subunit B
VVVSTGDKSITTELSASENGINGWYKARTPEDMTELRMRRRNLGAKSNVFYRISITI